MRSLPLVLGPGEGGRSVCKAGVNGGRVLPVGVGGAGALFHFSARDNDRAHNGKPTGLDRGQEDLWCCVEA